MRSDAKTRALLVLADGHVFEGKSLGARGVIIGETVFTTGMNGYIETLTDPSYYGQIVTQTFPLIGNYGMIPKDYESASCHVHGYIVQSWCDAPSNFRSGQNLDAYLKEQSVIGIYGIDTRALTKILREAGVMNGLLVSGESEEANEIYESLLNAEKKEKVLERIRAYRIENAVRAVTGSASKIEQDAGTVFAESAEYKFLPVRKDGTRENDMQAAMRNGLGKKVVLWDFGAKANIRRELLKRGLDVVTVPSTATAREILALNPCGIMLSNGPGDPAENTAIINEIKIILEKGIPVFGICLGHQLLALANGARTSKLKYGHRGANQPVKYLATGRVYISSQNHGYAVENDSLPDGAVLSFVNTNDGTCEGIVYTKFPAFSVQFHPEACGGPLDTGFLFDDFVNLINDRSYFENFSATSKRIDTESYFSEVAQKANERKVV